MRSRLASLSAVLVAVLLIPPAFAFDTPLSPEAVRDAYFLGQRNDQSTLSFFTQYLRTLPAPESGPYIAEVEVYTPYTQIVETSRRRSMGYSAQQAEHDYQHSRDKVYVRVRIDFTDTYGALELYRSAKADKEISGADQPLPDFYRDFRVGLSQRAGDAREERWIEPLRIMLQPSYAMSSGHYAFIPSDLSSFAYASAIGGYGYDSGTGFFYPTGWLGWLEYDANDIAPDDANVEVITTDGQHVSVPFDLSRLR